MSLLSKTRYLQYLQCPKLLWLSIHTPSVIPPPTESDLNRMAQGRKVEEAARQMFVGSLIDHSKGLDAVVAESNAFLFQPHPDGTVFRPVVRAGRLVAEMDIVSSRDGLLNIFEVKSGSGVKDKYLPDVAFQQYVAGKSGANVSKCSLILINTDYVRRGSIDAPQLFKVLDVIADLAPHSTAVEGNVAKALDVIDSPTCPVVAIGPHCSDCPLKGTPDGCWKAVNAEPNNVFSLYRLQSSRAWGLFEQGYLKNSDIPADFTLTDKQTIQVKAEVAGKPFVIRQVQKFIAGLKFPLYFLDFETFASAIPLIDNSSPYEQVPFQFSLHVLKDFDGQPQHLSWIWDGDLQEDPREEMLHGLKSLLGNAGSILAYNATFEKMVLGRATGIYSDYGDWLKGILPRFNDLLVPFRNFVLYHPDQHGSCSLKVVLPAWTGKGYGGMAISNGEQAGREFMRVMFSNGTDGEKERLKLNLEAYCGLDTFGMVELLRVMNQFP